MFTCFTGEVQFQLKLMFCQGKMYIVIPHSLLYWALCFPVGSDEVRVSTPNNNNTEHILFNNYYFVVFAGIYLLKLNKDSTV